MRQFFIATLLLLITGVANAQLDGKIIYHCSYYGDNAKLTQMEICLREGTVPGLLVHERAGKIVSDIMAEVGLPINFILVECRGIENCKAVNLLAKKGFLRYIIYDDKFLQELDSASTGYWASVSIFAHEIGHHLSGHTLDSLGSRPDKELEADRFSGFIMYRLGATLEQAQAAMKQLGDVPLVSTHPPLANRLAAIRNGWNEGWSTNYRQQKNQNTIPSLKPLEEIAVECFDRAYLDNILGKHDEAIGSCNAALRLKANYAAAYCQRGLAEANLLRTSDAIRSLDSALLADPAYILAQAYKGRAYGKAKMYGSANLEFEKAIKMDSNFGATYAERAWMRIEQGLYVQAIRDAERALDLEYQDAHLPLSAIGYAYFKQNKYSQAVMYFSTALDYNPVFDFARKWGMEAYRKMQAAEKKPKTPVKTVRSGSKTR
ncbi:MAG TPA: M48 family metalloprotease [Chitinophagaceae bacterium]|nr:M48 family metalloprotease [Chitinophagaceae bacterium]